MQRPSIAENLSESIRCLQNSVEAAWQDGVITDAEKFYLRQEFLKTKKRARVVIAMQTLGFRLIKTGKADKNLITELRALSSDGQKENHILSFEDAVRRRTEAGMPPDSAA